MRTTWLQTSRAIKLTKKAPDRQPVDGFTSLIFEQVERDVVHAKWITKGTQHILPGNITPSITATEARSRSNLHVDH
jgi:hypothetical protein